MIRRICQRRQFTVHSLNQQMFPLFFWIQTSYLHPPHPLHIYAEHHKAGFIKQVLMPQLLHCCSRVWSGHPAEIVLVTTDCTTTGPQISPFTTVFPQTRQQYTHTAAIPQPLSIKKDSLANGDPPPPPPPPTKVQWVCMRAENSAI